MQKTKCLLLKMVQQNGAPRFKNEYFRKYVGKNMNMYDILGEHLRYLAPVQFEEMIEKWEVCMS